MSWHGYLAPHVIPVGPTGQVSQKSICVLLLTMGPTVQNSQQVIMCSSCQWVPHVNEFKTMIE